MQEKEKEELKARLIAEKDRLSKHVSDLKELTKPIAPENAIGRVSRMDAINNKSVNEAALRKAEKKLKGITTALENINEKDFGLCKRCGREIPFQRLLIMPESTRCVICAQR